MAINNKICAYFVYVLRNAANTTYTGIAKDVDARLTQHNANVGARFTRGRGPWWVAHREGPFNHGDALRREMAIKRDRRFKAMLKINDSMGLSDEQSSTKTPIIQASTTVPASIAKSNT